MDRILQKRASLSQRKQRIRSIISGDAERPRLSISISNRHVTAQLIDDEAKRTIASVTTVGLKNGGNLTSKAAWAGQEIAKKAKAGKVKKAVLDRNGRLYHGRIKALADAARAEGLEF